MDAREFERQVDGVIRSVRNQLDGGWARGARYGKEGPCLVGAIDAVTSWTIPGVRGQVQRELVACLPRTYGLIARVRPRLALALYNDLGSQSRSRDLAWRAQLEREVEREALVIVA